VTVLSCISKVTIEVRFDCTLGTRCLCCRGLRTTAQGLNVVDSIMPELLNVMDKYFELMQPKALNVS